MTDEEHRKKSRLSLERWRRSRGVKPKKRPLPRPWLAEGVPQSTWYRRRKQEQDAAARNEISKPAELIQVTGHHLLTLNARRAITILGITPNGKAFKRAATTPLKPTSLISKPVVIRLRKPSKR